MNDHEKLIRELTMLINKSPFTLEQLGKKTNIRPSQIRKFLLYDKIPRLDQYCKLLRAVKGVDRHEY